MYLRRLYYDLTDGGVVSHRMARGDIYAPTVEDDFARLPELTGRSGSDTGLMQWDQPEASVEANAAAGRIPGVDLSVHPPVLTWTEPEPEESRLEDALSALEALGVDTHEGEAQAWEN